ncbi:DUF1353 domain-containing protein [Methylopila sp. M107]|uniref:DUF1353 domain-containing protein n=1 Tax=Methylopila sp. M107 TaxID=1101190 RepID=UPI0003774428|nr:DUF1353 domain-containing protein [Methylopila sp. M107]
MRALAIDTVRRCLFAAVLLAATPAGAQFSGDLAFTPDVCKAKRSCILKSELVFKDDAGRVWRAEAGGVTDGASIPDWAQGVIGGPWDEAYVKAAALHDQYCGSMRRSWKETHRMFHDALVALGVGQFKAKVMYYAVYLGGPKWEVATESPCDPAKGETCMMSLRPDGLEMVVRPERYGQMDMRREMRAAEEMLARNPRASLEELEAMADRRRPED